MGSCVRRQHVPFAPKRLPVRLGRRNAGRFAALRRPKRAGNTFKLHDTLWCLRGRRPHRRLPGKRDGAIRRGSRELADHGRVGRPGFFRTVALIRAANRPSLASIRGRLAGPPPCPRSLSVSEHVIHATDADFNATVLQSAEPVLVDFWAPWCGPCKMIAPALDELAGEYAGKVKIAKVNVD